jgi:hypothetical protein
MENYKTVEEKFWSIVSRFKPMIGHVWILKPMLQTIRNVRNDLGRVGTVLGELRHRFKSIARGRFTDRMGLQMHFIEHHACYQDEYAISRTARLISIDFALHAHPCLTSAPHDWKTEFALHLLLHGGFT